MSDAEGSLSSKSGTNAASVLNALAALVEQAEALEASGRYREAAELTAKAMTQAHADYVLCHTGGLVDNTAMILPAPAPMLPMPRRSYIERYKARLRVDWEKWDRCSLRMVQVDGTGEADEGYEDVGSEELSAIPEQSASRVANSAFDADDNPDEWRPETLAKQEASSGRIELIHTKTDGTQVVVVTVARPDVPPRAQYQFNREQKSTVKKLLQGDADLTDGRNFSHREIARWLLTGSKLSKNRIGDYLGRSDEDAVQLLKVWQRALRNLA